MISPYYSEEKNASYIKNFGQGIVLHIDNIKKIEYIYNRIMNSTQIIKRRLVITYENKYTNYLYIHLGDCADEKTCRLDFDNITNIEHEYKESGLFSTTKKHTLHMENLNAFINLNLFKSFSSKSTRESEKIILSDEDM